MSRLQKFNVSHVLKWVSLLRAQSNSTLAKSSLYVNESNHILKSLRFYGAESSVSAEDRENAGEHGKIPPAVRKQAQAALIEYFHLTRSLQFLDAENMSKNTPVFFVKFVKKVDIDRSDVGRSVARFLRYHPPNEFEPFFESIGLKPSEYSLFLPRDMLFLADDEFLLENYYALCNYGIERKKIGKIYKEATEVFGYGHGVLKSKLLSFENFGLRRSLVAKIVASSPHLLTGNVDSQELVGFMENLKKLRIEHYWLEQHICVEDSYNWRCMLQLMCLLCELGMTEKQIRELLTKHPDILLECSGRSTFSLVGLLLKFGSAFSDVQTVFLQFPRISVSRFTNNLCNCYKFLNEIGMAVQDIGGIVRSHPVLLGSCELKQIKSLVSLLSCGKNRMRQMIKDDPSTLGKWVLGVRTNKLEEQKRVDKVRILKTQFLLNLGYKEKSKEMEKAFKAVRGKGTELQERFDCLVSNGFSREEVIRSIKVSPQILNQSIHVIEKKISFFVSDLGYRVCDLLTHPKLLSYNIDRLKLRLLMYRWLRDEGAVRPNLRLSTLLSSSEGEFVRTYVNSHPEGPKFWERLKKEICTDNR